MLAIWDKFKENGIKIPYPQRDVHIKQLPTQSEVLPREENLKTSQE
jgi:small-conductance mechanosensitive channel